MSYQPPAGQQPQWSQAGPPPPAKKRKKWPLILLGIVVVIIIIVVSTSGGKKDDSSETASGASGASTAQQQEATSGKAKATPTKASTEATVGGPVTVSTPNTDAVFTIANLRPGNDEFGFAKGSLFVVDATIQSNKGTIAINPLYFSARGADGQTFDYSPTSDGALDARELPAGGKLKGAVGFDVPEGQTISEIILQDPIGAQQASWKVAP